MGGAASVTQGIVLAAGQGVRLGAGPKAFVVLGGQTLLERVVRTLREVVPRVIAAVPRDERAKAEAVVGELAEVIDGGSSRFETLRLLVEGATGTTLVLHDVVHPLTSAALIERVVAEAQRTGAAAAALPAMDFVHRVDGSVVGGPGDLWVAQKPIVFRRAAMLQALALGRERAHDGVTRDPGSVELLRFAGQPVAIVRGDAWNLKLTDADDRWVLETLLAASVNEAGAIPVARDRHTRRRRTSPIAPGRLSRPAR